MLPRVTAPHRAAPLREMLRGLADRYYKLGVIGSARVLYEQLHDWDMTVKCYTILGNA